MRIEALALRDFRNLRQADMTPGEGINLLYGDNAQGKTNLVEAIYLLTGQKGFRQSREADYIRFEQSRAEIRCRFFQGGRSQTASLVYSRGDGAAPRGGKTAQINEIDVQPSELTGLFCAVVFSPTEVGLIKEGPALRRAFLDSAISQVMPRYLRNMAAFGRALSQRNSLLYDMARHSGMDDLLAVWDRSFAKAAYSVINARWRYVTRLTKPAEEIYRDLSGDRETFSAEYQSSIPGAWGALDAQAGEAHILEALEASREEDLKNGFTTIGPHRDDLSVALDGVPARTFGSQGQQRSCALTLKLAECAVIEEVSGERPILLLDDVLSELDKRRRDYFLSGAGTGRGQMFITCTDRAGFRAVRQGVTMRIQNGEIKARRQIGGA